MDKFYWTVQLLLWFPKVVRNFQPLFLSFLGHFCFNAFWFALTFLFYFQRSTILFATHSQKQLQRELKHQTITDFLKSYKYLSISSSTLMYFHKPHRFKLIKALLTIKLLEMKVTQKCLTWNLHNNIRNEIEIYIFIIDNDRLKSG